MDGKQFIADKLLLDNFKCMLVANKTPKVLNYQFMTKGILLNFVPLQTQVEAIKQYIRDANVSTMFSVDEVNNLSTDEKILKQLNHYALQFGTNYAFDVMRATDTGSNAVTITLIRGVTSKELQLLIDDSLYSNRPVKDSKAIVTIIKHYGLVYRISDIKNNELRVALFDVNKDKFTNGDDAVRYLVNVCGESDLLIKSKDVVAKVQANASKVSVKFIENHASVLSEVFNRHKRIIMAVKLGNKALRSVINRISRHSKQTHKPIAMAKSKTFVADALKVKTYNYRNLDKFSLRDKLKILNLLEFKTKRLTSDIFVIRNGRTHLAEDRPVYEVAQIKSVIEQVLRSIEKDLAHLKGKTIVLPKEIDYGLSISRKQSVGNLPFGTKVYTEGREISAGVYWRNDWGARDIDLSAIDNEGNRTGWGSRYGYGRGGSTGVQFSGDIVNAPDGAMEFLTSHSEHYGLFANIFSGEPGAKIQVLVGTKQREQWIENTVIREELSLKSRGNIVGFVQGKTFTVFYGRMNESHVSNGRNKVMIQKALSMKWTVRTLLDHFGIAHVEQAKKADFDLSYAGFTYDKLEALFMI